MLQNSDIAWLKTIFDVEHESTKVKCNLQQNENRDSSNSQLLSS